MERLHEPAFRPLRLGEVRPAGWLRDQLRTQARGQAGNLDLFWPDVRDSRWTGGDAEGWERLPYWLDGILPLAFLLDDPELRERAVRPIDRILDRQAADGWIGPEGDRAGYDVWALFLMLKVLTVLHDATGDSRVEGAVERALRALDRHLDAHPLFEWGHARWFECLIPVFWLYERTGASWLLALAGKLHAQGFDWTAFLRDWPYPDAVAPERTTHGSHVVDNAMMLKAGVLRWRTSGDPADLAEPAFAMEALDRCHGTVVGTFTGDEHLGGLSPVRGTELCAVVETMYSLEHILAITGDPGWGDRLERIAFNALPATFSPDMWSHQYDQQVNQVLCAFQERPVFGTNNGESHLFGLEPNYGCCTANQGQAWPKFAASLAARAPDGLAVLAWAPCEVSADVEGVPVEMSVDTGYPFRDSVRLRVRAARPVRFALSLRIPGWAAGAEVRVDGGVLRPEAGIMARVVRTWEGETELLVHFPMEPRLVARPHGLVAVERGPLVYSLAVGERWVRVHEDVPGREPPHCDYEVHPTTAWAYGLALDPSDPGAALAFSEKPVGPRPFSPEGAPVEAAAPGRTVEWELVDGSAAPVPRMGRVGETVGALRLIPYGCTCLRLTEMPLVPAAPPDAG
jgi:hypothetical protein